MINREKRIELLAPAGSFESMKAAVSAGADAVYIGGSRFGARAYADNPDEERLLDAIDYTHLHGVALHMTVNTLVKEKELDSLYVFLRLYYERGLDAVIVQDLGVLSVIRQYFPDLHIHASTQMTLTGPGGARILKDMGASRIVTARELSLGELRNIHEEVDIEIESFIHGALCYCYSGQCLLSSLIGGRSGNRGRCAQPCRLPYDVLDHASMVSKKDERYVMSLKDLCTLDILPDILEAGVTSLKIEGRMKSPRYTAGVVSIYRKYLDLYERCGRDGYHVDKNDKKLLLDLFDRGGHTQGYYKQHNGKGMLALHEKPEFRQVNQQLFDYIDKTCVNTEKREMIDGCLNISENPPMELTLSYRDAHGQMIRVQAAGPAAQTAQNQPATADRLKKQIQKTGGTPYEFRNLEIHVDGNVFVPVQALNELRRNALEQLESAALKRYRRECSGKYQSVKIAMEKSVLENLSTQESPSEAATVELHVLVTDILQFECALKEADIAEIQIESDMCHPKEWKSCVDRCHVNGKHCVLTMPMIFREEARTYFDKYKNELMEAGFDGFLIRSLEEMDYVRKVLGQKEKNSDSEKDSLLEETQSTLPEESNCKTPIYSDHNLYSFNHRAAGMMLKTGADRLTYPLELNVREIMDINASSPRSFELIAYGSLPVMVTAQCIRRTVDVCLRHQNHKSGRHAQNQAARLSDHCELTLRDRTGKSLPVYNHCDFCYNTIYNPNPLSLLGMEEDVKRIAPAALRLQFLNETPSQMSEIVHAYRDAFLLGRKVDSPIKNFTRGHLKRGVE